MGTLTSFLGIPIESLPNILVDTRFHYLKIKHSSRSVVKPRVILLAGHAATVRVPAWLHAGNGPVLVTKGSRCQTYTRLIQKQTNGRFPGLSKIKDRRLTARIITELISA